MTTTDIRDIDDIDLDDVCATCDVYYADGSEETVDLPTIDCSDEYDDWEELDWVEMEKTLSPKLYAAIQAHVEAYAAGAAADRAVQRAESGYC